MNYPICIPNKFVVLPSGAWTTVVPNLLMINGVCLGTLALGSILVMGRGIEDRDLRVVEGGREGGREAGIKREMKRGRERKQGKDVG